MKIVHAADLHLDSPLRGLGHSDDAPVDEIRGATRRAFENLVSLCVEEAAALLVIAGDLYDGDWKDYGTGLFFSRMMAELRQAGVEVVWIRGNHDAASKLTKHLRLPDNVRELSCRRAESVRFDRLGVAVHGQGFVSPAMTEDISARYPEPFSDLFNVGLLHTALDGRPGHAPYAPCKLQALVDKGYEYWALGHVHQAEILHREPWVVFPGNLQGRHARETGAKGAVVIEVDDGRVRSVETRSLDVVRWAVCRVEAIGAPDADAVIDRVRAALEAEADAAEGRLLAARVVVSGPTGGHQTLANDLERFGFDVRSVAQDVGPVWIERVELATQPLVDVAALEHLDGPIGELARSLAALQNDEDGLRWLASELVDLTSKLPPELRKRDDGSSCDDPEALRRMLSEVQSWVLPRLMADEDAAGTS